ncbi:2,3-bisphosphoglycerate-independent phosphoglycerate mutase [Candidatus Termititenax persephonae]|uniref:2,3-bisphosphoglycerate-independent phosphoglycerate mutase n=1 Tax=Candidatus Termititenax persephonae TaxID=2218525 RepID=A0A388TFG0_9BACT|nr:2,3-bisphosphoglycerate-independent phosphoglycerate mutase [Candidatus Termititenax persephonae]
MKYLILIGDGMSGRPLTSLGSQTTLETARTPNIDKLLSAGLTGLVQNVPHGLKPGSDVANMSIFGYDPRKYYSGRAPLEAAAMGIRLGRGDVAFRCNLVTIRDGKMQDFTAGHIPTKAARRLLKKINKKLGDARVKFYPGVSYRHLCVIKNGNLKVKCTPPHDITGRSVKKYLPPDALLQRLMTVSQEILAPEKTKATQIWLWGQGQAPKLVSLAKKYKLRGAVITAVDLIKGLGHYAGLKPLKITGATGFLDTNYAGKARAALRTLRRQDIVLVHVEPPDECGHMGDSKLKIRAIEDFDRKIVGPIINALFRQKTPFRVLILPDHPTPICLKTHSGEPVPFVYFDSAKPRPRCPRKYSEKTARQTGLYIPHGHELLGKLYAGF